MKEHVTQSNSAIKQHIAQCPSCQTSCTQADVFSIIDTGKNDFETTIKEAIHIKCSKPVLNKQLFVNGVTYTTVVF